jgi:phospholipase C
VHTPLDFTSILRFIEDNWSLEPLGSRDAGANSISSGFDFSTRPRRPEFTSPVRGVTFESHVRRSVIFVLYGGALALTGALVILALLGRGLGRPKRSRRIGGLP